MAAPKRNAKLSPDDALVDYRAFFHGADERKIVFRADDPTYTFVDVTEGHLNMTGAKREDIIGRGFFEIFPDVTEKYKKTGVSELLESFREIKRTKQPFYNDIMRYDIADGKGGYTERYWRPTHYPILGADGEVAYILQTSEDVTGEIIAERDMRDMRDQLGEAHKIGRIGSWVWDIESNTVVIDSGMAVMFGIPARQAHKTLPMDVLQGAVYPEDRKRVMRATAEAVKKGSAFEAEYRVVDDKQAVRWILARGRVENKQGRRLFPGVIVDITERRDLQAQVELARQQDQLNRQQSKILQQRNEQLEQVSRTKDEFVALASHQLRTPATAVKQYLGMVMQGYAGDISELQADMLNKAFESNERQIQIINQILNAARADTGRLIMTKQPLDITRLCRVLAEDMRPSIESRSHQFEVRLPRASIMVEADTSYLRMAIENLLHNASIYTQEGGKVKLSLKKANSKQICICVSDNGVGIRKADLDKLFTKFSRIHNPLSVQAGGSGIGLYLTAEIVRLHDGTITVESKINKGTTFSICLPILPTSPKQRGDS